MRKCVLLCFLILLTLGSTGAGYALWSKTLYIDATINTGDVDAEWTYTSCDDEEQDKDVGTITAEIDLSDSQILHFTIDNGYPCYTADCEVEFTYRGSVPGIVQSISFVPGTGLTNCQVDQSPFTGTFVAECDQLTVIWADGKGSQLHDGDFLGSSLRVHVEQPAEENSQYDFDVELQLVQWNEYEP